MKFEGVKKLWPLAPIALILAIGYAVTWMDRVGCGETPLLACWISAAANRGADLLWLGWIRDYQGVLSGILTLAGGSFVLFAGAQQIHAAKQQAQEQRSSRLRSLLATTKLGFAKALIALDTENVPKGEHNLPLIQAIIPELTSYEIRFAEVVARAAHYAEAGLTRVGGPHWQQIKTMPEEVEQVRNAIGNCFLLVKYLENIDMLIATDGTFGFPRLPSSHAFERQFMIKGGRPTAWYEIYPILFEPPD